MISALLLSSLLTAFVLMQSMSLVWTREEQLEEMQHIQAENDAYSCAYEGLLAYEEDPYYAGTLHQHAISLYTPCTIDVVSTSSGALSVISHAQIQNAYAAISLSASATISSGTPAVRNITWRDITSIPP
jgi:Tfp pilus assembly protein PilV